MVDRGTVVRGIELALVVVLVILVIGQLSGQPILLTYVETESMAPTLQAGDGFIAVPAAVSGPIEAGDVIVFRAERLDGGGLVTHRVVDTTPDGAYITKGDANPFTDQDGGEPPVQDAQVVATAYQFGGDVVAIPYLGVGVLAASEALETVQSTLAQTFRTRALLGTEGLAYLLFGLGLLAYFGSLLLATRRSDGRARHRERDVDVLNASAVIVSLTLLLVLVITASMVFSGGSHQFEVISSTSDAPGPRVIGAGTTETVEFVIPSNGMVPVVVFLEAEGGGIDVEPSEVYVPSNAERTVTVSLTAPDETGRSLWFVTEHRYLAVLPRGTIRALYSIHPWLPIVVIDALAGVGFAGLGAALLGTGRVRIRPDRRPSLRARLQRWLR